MPSDTKLVYSTSGNNLCKRCGKAHGKCRCSASTPAKAPSTGSREGLIILSRETKGRKGKGVTLITGLPMQEKEIKAFAKTLKAYCGSGGSLKNGVIEIQGDHRSKLATYLEAKGYRSKISGG